MTGQSQTLYRKWRSQTFADLVGQDAVTQTLRQAVKNDRLTHAYLFCGPRGTGKTSSARLLAKMVNCEALRDGEPCNECLPCREITEGRSTDVYEIDAASNRGIDEIRDLRDRVRIMSATGRTRLYIIDEAHMLTTEAFNALLKTLEEPPPHVIFVLATTEAHKVPATVVSRCQRFDFRRIALRDIISRLSYVATQEELRVEAGAIELLARAAQGGMRDALSLLDQARAFSGDAIATEAVRGMLGMADPALVQELIDFVATSDTAAGLHRINELAQSGVDLRQLTGQIAELWRQLMLSRAGADIASMLDLNQEDAAALKVLGERFTLAALTECARIFARNDGGARRQVVPQLALELAFLDCVAAVHQPQVTPVVAAPQQVVAAASPRVAVIQEPAQPYTPPVTPLPPVAAPASSPAVIESMPVSPPAAATVSQANGNGKAPATPDRPTPPPPIAPSQETASAAATQPGGAKVAAAEVFEQVRNQWELIKQACRTINTSRGNSVKAFLNEAHPVKAEAANPISIVVAVDFEWHLNKLSQPESRQIVEKAIAAIIEQPCQVLFISKDAAGGMEPVAMVAPTPVPPAASPSAGVATPATPPVTQAAPDSAPATDTGEQDLRTQVQRDPVVRELQREYGARVINIKAANG